MSVYFWSHVEAIVENQRRCRHEFRGYCAGSRKTSYYECARCGYTVRVWKKSTRPGPPPHPIRPPKPCWSRVKPFKGYPVPRGLA